MRIKFVSAILCCLSCLGYAGNSGPLAEINGRNITEEDVKRLMQLLGPQADVVASNADLRVQLVRNLIDRIILTDKAKDAEIEKDPDFARKLELLRDDLLVQVYLDRRMKNELTEAKLHEFFEKNMDRLSMKEVRLSRITIRDKVKAVGLYQQLKTKPSNFAILARKYSKDVNVSKTGGDMGYVRKGQLDGPLDDFAFSSPKGALSPVLVIDGKYVMVMVMDIDPGKTVKYNDVREDVIRLAKHDLEEKIIEDIRQTSNIKVHEDVIRRSLK